MLFIATCCHKDSTHDIFPLEHYSQNTVDWFKPTALNAYKNILSKNAQNRFMTHFLKRYIGHSSPWDLAYVKRVMHSPTVNQLSIEQRNLTHIYNNHGKPVNSIGYGFNFRPHDKTWMDNIKDNMNMIQLNNHIIMKKNRAIAIDNAQVRVLPTHDMHFYSQHIAGQGFPFDNLQLSSLWVGTPVYVINESKDHAWLLIITADFVGWVDSKKIAYVDEKFIHDWKKAAKKNLVAIVKTKTNIFDEKGRSLLTTYIGTALPAQQNKHYIKLLVPVKSTDQYARIQYAIPEKSSIAMMPLATTSANFVRIIQQLLGRPYGWGGMQFYNDCSAELKSLFTPFGIWLPRNSEEQADIGRIIDQSNANPKERLAYLTQYGVPFLTIVYVGKHVFLYLGQYHDPKQKNALVPLSYQSVWGLRPASLNKRSIIGKSVLLPILLKYPEDKTLLSFVERKYFKLIFLNQ